MVSLCGAHILKVFVLVAAAVTWTWTLQSTVIPYAGLGLEYGNIVQIFSVGVLAILIFDAAANPSPALQRVWDDAAVIDGERNVADSKRRQARLDRDAVRKAVREGTVDPLVLFGLTNIAADDDDE